ncbi:MAG: hypothetical protein IH865_07015 [Chloroflexi bacterium]|nr:hypothetical protein [Chloroflexota bacterium]
MAGLIGSLQCEENADANEDGTTNAIDAALILQLTAGLLPNLPPKPRLTVFATCGMMLAFSHAGSTRRR